MLIFENWRRLAAQQHWQLYNNNVVIMLLLFVRRVFSLSRSLSPSFSLYVCRKKTSRIIVVIIFILLLLYALLAMAAIIARDVLRYRRCRASEYHVGPALCQSVDHAHTHTQINTQYIYMYYRYTLLYTREISRNYISMKRVYTTTLYHTS